MTRDEFRRKLTTKLRRHGHRAAVRAGLRRPCEYLVLGNREWRIWHRATRADSEAINQCLWQRQYDIPMIRGPLADSVDGFHAAILARGATPLIVDAGSHIGASAVWFSARFPGSRVVAIEPAPENFALLSQNAAPIGVTCIQAGLGAQAGTARLTNSGHNSWGYRTVADAEGPAVPIITLQDVLGRWPGSDTVPFVLKLDIEGAEAGLFDQEPELFARFPVIIIELHDWMLPGAGSSRSFLGFHLAQGRDALSRGENVFSLDFGRLRRAGTA